MSHTGNSRGRLILVRHGESTGNVERVYTHTPIELPLTDVGRQQAHDAATKIASRFKPALVVTSHYHRARDTAAIIAADLALPLKVEPDLHERLMGDFVGMPYDAMAADPTYDPAQPWLWTPPRGESLSDVMRRAAPVVAGLARAHPARDVIVVSHGGVMVSLWAHVTGSWVGVRVPPNCGIVVIEHAGGAYRTPQVIED